MEQGNIVITASYGACIFICEMYTYARVNDSANETLQPAYVFKRLEDGVNIIVVKTLSFDKEILKII